MSRDSNVSPDNKERLSSTVLLLTVALLSMGIGYMQGVEHPTLEAGVSDCNRHGGFESHGEFYSCVHVGKAIHE